MSEDPSRLYSAVFAAIMLRMEESQSLLKVAEFGTPAAAERLLAENRRFARDLASNPEYDRYFTDRSQAVTFLGGEDAIGATMTARQLDIFHGSVDAAALVFVHSMLDSALTDLCRVSALIAPTDWLQFLTEQKFSIGAITTTGVDQALKEKVLAYIEALSRESLLKRIDRLWAVCAPPAVSDLIGDYTFDRPRLEALDKLRQQIIHSQRRAARIPQISDSLTFLAKTGMLMFAMVNHKYDVKIDPIAVLETQTGQTFPRPKAV